MDIEKLLEERAHLIDEEIERVFPKGGVPNLYDAVWYHLGTGGKRVRPMLAILTYEALGGKPEKILPFAAACELLHNWLLVHDDIEDGDRVRRNKPAVWVKYGLAHGVNVGDLMAQKVLELVLKSRQFLGEKTTFRLAAAMITAAVKTAEGQAMDINMRGSRAPTENEYMEMITRKTAHYMTVPMIGAAIAAGSDEGAVNRLIEFGSFIGPAFQITDDILDLTEGKGRGEIGRDIKEGKRSILVIHCMAHCKGDERKKIAGILNKAPEETTDGDVKFVKELFEKHGSVEYARKKAEELARKAKKVADGAPKELRDILYFFADYLVKREK